MIDDTHAHTHSSPAMTVLNFVGSMLWGHLDDYDFDDVNDEAVSNPNTNNDSNDGTNDGAQTNISTTDVNVQLTTHPADGVYSDTEADHYQHMDENDVANVDAKNDEEIKTNDSENGKEDADSGGGGCFGGLFSHARTKSAVERQMTLSAQTTLKRVKTIRSNERVSAEQVQMRRQPSFSEHKDELDSLHQQETLLNDELDNALENGFVSYDLGFNCLTFPIWIAFGAAVSPAIIVTGSLVVYCVNLLPGIYWFLNVTFRTHKFAFPVKLMLIVLVLPLTIVLVLLLTAFGSLIGGVAFGTVCGGFMNFGVICSSLAVVRWYDALVRMVFVQGRIFAIDDQECSLWEDTSPAYDVETGAVVGSDGQGNRCKYNNPIKILVSLILGGFIGMVYTCVCFVFMSVVHGPIAFLLIVKGTLMMVYGFPFLILFCPVAIGLAAALAVLWIPYNIVLGLVLGFYTGFISSYLASVECTGISGVFLSLEMMTEHIYTRYTSEVALLTYLSGVFAR